MSNEPMTRRPGLALVVVVALAAVLSWKPVYAIVIGAPADLPAAGDTTFRQLLAQRRYSEARDRAESLLQDAPDEVDLLVILGYAQAGLENWEAARRSIDRAVRLAPNARRDSLRLSLADVLLSQGDTSAAGKLLGDIGARNSKNARLLSGVAQRYLLAGDLTRAKGYFQRALAIDPDQEAALTGVLRIHLNEGDYRAVIRVARRVPDGSAGKSVAKYFQSLALIRQQKPDYRAAAELLEQALEGSRPTPRMLYVFGYVLLQEQRQQEGVRRLQQAVALAPDFFDALKLLGVVSLKMNQPKAASEYLEAALGIKDSPDLRYLLGQSYLRQGRSKEAVTALMASLESADLDPASRSTSEGLYSYVGGDLEQSEIALRKALETTPGAADARVLLVVNLLKQGRFEGAAREARQGLELNPQARLLLLNLLAQARLGGGDLDGAETALRDALEDDPGSVRTRMNLSGVYFRQGRFAEAKAGLEDILTANPGILQVRLRLARVHQASGNYQEAERVLLGPQDTIPEAQILLRELFLLKIRQREYHDAREYAGVMIAGYPSLFEGYLLESQAYAALGRTADAGQSLASGFDKAGESRESLAMAARLSRAYGWHDRAVRYLQHYSAQFGLDDPRLKKLYATELIEVGETNKARAVIRQGLSPTDPDAAFLLARSYIEDGDQLKAEEAIDAALEAGVSDQVVEAQRAQLRLAIGTKELQEAVRSKPDDASRYRALAEAYEFLGKPEAAIDVYRDGIGKAGQDLLFETQIARLLLKAGDAERAIEVANGVLNRIGTGHGDDTEIRAQAVLGMSWLRLGNTQKAEQALQRATAEGSRLSPPFYALARIKAARGDDEAAIRLLRSAIAIEPAAVRYYLALAALYQRAARFEESIAVYEDGLASNPESVPLLNNAALLHLSRGANQNALSLAGQALELAPEDANVLDTVGWIHLQSNDLDGAIRHLELAVDREPTSALYRYHLGLGYFEKGALALAKAELEAALNRQADAPWNPAIEQMLAAIARKK
jgi:tetratricopeptide (TPR) repeat protein